MAIPHAASEKENEKTWQKVKDISYLRELPLEERPKEVVTRLQVGHWETDNLGGKQTDRTTLSGTIERKARFTHLDLLPNKYSITKMGQLKQRFKKYPRFMRQTMTIDNGPENAKHARIKHTFPGGVYSCHPYHSWEKGSVENMFGRVRRFIPKGTSLDTIDQQTIQTIEHWLNHTPRKCLGYKTPYEIMRQELKSINNQSGALQLRM